MFNFYSKAQFNPGKVTNILRSPFYYDFFSHKADRIQKYLSQYPDVRKLDLSNMINLTANDIQVLFEGLKDTNILELKLKNCNIADDGAQAIAEGLKDTNITSLNLYGNQIDYEGVKALAQGLIGSKVTKVNLGFNHIGLNAINVLAESLKKTNLTSLKLDLIRIGDEGAIALAQGLKDSNILILNLRHCGIGDVGANALVGSLKGTNVTKLSLYMNNISNEGVKALAQVLKDTNLTSLNLFNTKIIGDDALKVLAEGLKDTKLIRLSLNLFSRQVSSRQKKEIADILDANEQRIYGNQIPDAISAPNESIPSKEPAPKSEQVKHSRSGFLKSVSIFATSVLTLSVGIGAYIWRKAIADGAKNLAMRAGLTIPGTGLVPVAIVAPIVGLLGLLLRRRKMSVQEKDYQNKTEHDLKALTPDHLNAFLDGVEAQKSYLAQAKTCFRFNDYRHGNAFYAGMGAQAHQNKELIEKVQAHKPGA